MSGSVKKKQHFQIFVKPVIRNTGGQVKAELNSFVGQIQTLFVKHNLSINIYKLISEMKGFKQT